MLIILVAGVLRFWGITHPPLEINHSWRQSLTNMIARNFVQDGYNFFYPTIDMAGDLSGVIGSEMPIFNSLIYVLSLLFGYEHWYGRLINLLVSSVGLWYFFKLIRLFFNKQLALYALVFLTTSIWFTFSRKIMPDTFSIALMIIAWYQGVLYLNTGRLLRVTLFFILGLLAVGSKLPAIGWYSLIVALFFSSHPVKRKWTLGILASVAGGVAFIWYFAWVPYLVETYQYQLFFPKPFVEGLNEISNYLPELAERFYFSAFYSYTAALTTIIGTILWFKQSTKKWFFVSLALIFIYSIFIIKTGAVFPTHNYYIIPLVPFMAFLAAFALAKIQRKWAGVILTVFVVESIANQQHDFFIKDNQRYKLELERIAEKNISESALIIINGGDSPQQIYFTNRKGWTVPSEKITVELVDSLTARGAKKLIINKHESLLPELKYDKEFENEHFILYGID